MTTRNRSRLSAIGLMCGAIAGFAQTPQTATLHVEAREVVLDVVVTDRKGNFVGGLTRDDFTVLEDKAKQRVVSFQTPAMHAIPAGAPEVHSTADLEKIGNAPVTIVVLDELNTQFADMAYARGSLEKWLEAQPAVLRQPTVMLVASDEKFAVLHDFTQDRAALQLALKQHFPSYPFRMSKGGAIGPDAGERMAISLGTLMQIAEASSGTPGRKNVIWVGVGFPQLLLDDVSGSKEDEITKAAVRATDAMLKARVTLNVIDPTAMADSSLDMNNPENVSLGDLQSSLGPTSTTTSGILNFDTFAPATGGKLYAGRNDIGNEVEQAVDNGANFYTLSYSPSNHKDDAAKFRNISIVMRDPNLVATTRTGYFPEAPAGAAPVAPATRDLAFDLTSAALSTITYNGVRGEAVKSGEGYVLRVQARDLKAHELGDGSERYEATVMWVCFGNKNKVLSHEAAELQSVAGADGMVVFTAPKVVVPRGTVRLRFVVRGAVDGHVGTIDVAGP